MGEGQAAGSQYSTVTALVLRYSMRASSPVGEMETEQSDKQAAKWATKPRVLTEVFAKAGLLEASEGRGHVCLVVGVDEDGPGLQALAHVHGLVDVPGEHSGGQAVLGVVGPLQHSFHVPAGQSNTSRNPAPITSTAPRDRQPAQLGGHLPVLKLGHHHHWAEGLLFGNEHVVFHVGEDSGLHEKTCGERPNDAKAGAVARAEGGAEAYLACPPVDPRTPAWLPPSRPPRSTPAACPGGPCGSVGHGLWSDPADLRFSSSLSLPPHRDKIRSSCYHFHVFFSYYCHYYSVAHILRH